MHWSYHNLVLSQQNTVDMPLEHVGTDMAYFTDILDPRVGNLPLNDGLTDLGLATLVK